MLTVYIWRFRGKSEAWGHAALAVQTTGGADYISWWPQSNNRVGQIAPNHALLAGRVATTVIAGPIAGAAFGQQVGQAFARQTSNVYCVAPIANRTHADDIRDEEQFPDASIVIDGLDDEAIRRWWRQTRIAPDAQWCTLGPNCSTTVANALKAGGADKFAPLWTRTNAVWTPNDVEQFARSVQEGIKKVPSRAGRGATGKW